MTLRDAIKATCNVFLPQQKSRRLSDPFSAVLGDAVGPAGRGLQPRLDG